MASQVNTIRRTPRPRYQKWLRLKSLFMQGLCVAFTIAILAVLAVVTIYLLIEGANYLSLSFFTEIPVPPPPSLEGYPGGMKHALVGSLILVGMASAVGIPLGVITGVYLSEYSAGSFLAGPVRFICDVLTGVPSIVVGILGYELVVRPIGNANGYAGAAALAFIMVPIVARTTEEMLRLVPHSYREASIALGATKARTIVKVVIPAASGSIVTGVMLAVARIAGETAPLLFTAGYSQWMTTDPSQPFPSLSVQIFEYAKGPYEGQQNIAWAGMLVLIALIFVINLAVRFTVYRFQAKKLVSN
jgi:phosphate transport system permease protein